MLHACCIAKLLGGGGGINGKCCTCANKGRAVNANVNSIILNSLPKSGKLFRIIEFTFAFTSSLSACASVSFAPRVLALAHCRPAAKQPSAKRSNQTQCNAKQSGSIQCRTTHEFSEMRCDYSKAKKCKVKQCRAMQSRACHRKVMEP